MVRFDYWCGKPGRGKRCHLSDHRTDGDFQRCAARTLALGTPVLEGVQFELSVSLHAPNDDIRNRLMPVNRRWPLAELLPACDAYTAATGRIITYEYTLVRGLNDRPVHAAELIRLLRGRKARVNLIPLSPVAEFDGQTPSHADCLAFLDALLKAGIHTTMRRSRGRQADAACGQLRLRTQKGPSHGTAEES